MKQKTKQLQSSGETRKTNRTWHFLSTLNSLLLSKLLLLLIIPVMGTISAWGADVTLTAASTNSSSAYYLAPDGTAVTAIAGLEQKAIAWENGAKITVDGKNNPDATLTFTLGTGVTVTSFQVLGTAQNNTTYALDGTSVTIGTALTGLSKTESMSFTLHCTDGTSSSSNRNTKITSIVLTYTTGGATTYRVTYDGNGKTGGSVPTDPDSPYASGATVTVLGNTGSLVKTGYTWSCWNTADNGGGTDYNADDTFTMGTSAVTLYAKWTANTYTVRFNANEGSGSMSNQGFTYGVAQTLTANSFTRSGYTFAGWNTEEDGSGTNYTDGQSVSNLSSTADDIVDLYAQWEAVGSEKFKFAVTETNSGTYSPSADLKNITESDAASVLDGGTMAIYNNKAETNDSYSSSGIVLNSNNDYLKITLESGTFAVGDVITVSADKDLCFTTDGAWNTTYSTSSGTYTITSTDGLAGKNTIYVHRKEGKGTKVSTITITGSAAAKYRVTYNANGGTGTVPTDANEYPSGSSVTVLGNTGPLAKEHHTFVGWNTSSSGTVSTQYSPDDTYSSISGDVTFYAVWKHMVTLNVSPAGAGTVSATYTDADTYYGKSAGDTFTSGSYVSDGIHLTLTATPATGYEFDYDYKVNPGDANPRPWGGATIATTNPASPQVGNNNDYVAHFKAKSYTITLDKNGGNTSGSVTATYNSSTLAYYSAATREGYVLKGYYTATSDGDKVIDAEGNLVASVSDYTDGNAKWISTDDDTPTLYAQWEAVFTVTFDATTNEGTCATASLTQATPGASITLPNASKDGNTFNGWFVASYGGESLGIGGGTYTPTGNVTLYAQFTPIVSGPKFHFLSKTSNDNINGTVDVTTSNYATTLDGGTLTYFSDGSRDYKYGLKLGSNAGYLKIELSKALAIGDVITFDQGTGSNQISFTTTSTRSTTPATSENAYTITSTDGLAGSETLYVWRATGSTTYVKELTIASTGAAATYAISYDVAGLADEMDDMADQETLPNPLPTPENVMEGYTFEGWYTNSTFTTRATAGATLGANTTLYANYIIDTPTITPASGAIYAGSGLTLTGSVPFTKVYAQWNGSGEALDKATAIAGDPTWSGEATDTYNFTCPDSDTGTRYVTFMVSDGTFYSRPAVTSAYTVSHLITITTQPKGATYILNASATALSVTANVTGSGTLSYLWESSGNGEDWSSAAGTNNEASYTPSTEATGTTYYRCTVSSNNGAASVTSNVVTVTVNAAAAFTVSFNTGVGSNVDIDDRTGTSITLPSVTEKSDDYEFVGWYDGDTKVGIAEGSYTPTGNITLTAKYNCMVTFDKSGDGSVSAVNASTGASISSPSKVLEGTEITLTATPTSVNEFESWSGDASGTTNPVTIEVSDVTSVTANFSVSEDKELFHTTFITADGWDEGSVNVLSGSTGNVVEKTIDDTKVTFAGKSGTSYTLNVNTTTNKLTYGGSNLNASAGSSTPNCYMAIHLTGVNGSITVDFGSSSQKWIYALDDGNTGAITTGKTQLGAAQTSFTLDNLKNDKVTLYLGQKGVTISELTITTPMTKLIADPTEVNFIGTASTADVKITTNSPGTVTPTSNNTSVATVSYNSTTKKVTVTPVAKGETTVTVQVAQSGAYPAKEIEIPVTVADPEIIVSTQPSNLACYQNEQTDKTFSVVASANTGAELSYQWYTCNADGTGEAAITGAISDTYTLNSTQKATVGTTYYKCKMTTVDSSCPAKYTNVVSVTVNALDAGGTYNATVYVAAPGNTLTYTGLSAESITSGASTTEFSASLSTGTLTITASAVGTNSVVLNDGTTINVTVKKHVIKLTWTAEKKQYTVTELSAKGITKDVAYTIDDGSHPENLPYLIRQYEDGTPYTGVIDFYSDDVTIAYFGTSGSNDNHWEKPAGSSDKPVIRYGGGQGGCVFYAYVPNDNANGVEAVKATYDLRIINGYSNDLPSGRKVSVQQQYTLYIPNTDTKLVTVTYGGYKYNNAKWSKGTDSWGTATNYVGKENVIDGYAYAVRNKDNDAADEYEHAIQVEDDFGSAWYASGEGGTSASYQRIKPFRLPCRASYLTFYAHQSGTLTAYVYQNGIVGRGGSANQLASAPRLGYWFDQEGWVQNPSATVVSKQKIANNNARDKRSYGGYADMDAQMDAYWTNTDDAIMKTKLRSHWCRVQHPDKDTPASDFNDDGSKPDGWYDNPYYWGTYDEISANNAQVVPTPETPVPHEGGHLIVNEGYVKYTIDVVAGKTYYFFGKMTKVGYAGMNFVPAGLENRVTSRVDLAANDEWSTAFGKTSGTRLNDNATTIYDEITVPSNYRIGKWNTICLPFSVNENQVEQVFGKGTELAIFNGLRHDTENHVYYIKYLRHVDQNILPGQPYLIYPTGKAVEERSNQDNGGMKETGEEVPTVGTTDKVIGSNTTGAADGATRLTFRNVIINKGITAQSYGCDVDADGTTTSYVFTGTDAQTAIEKYDIYNTPKTGELKRYMGSGTTLNTYHALMKASSEDIKQDAITFAFSEDDVEKSWESDIDDDPGEPTGIVIIEDEGTSDVRYSGKVTNGKSYNMMGQQVDPTSAKGIILINGKKVMY